MPGMNPGPRSPDPQPSSSRGADPDQSSTAFGERPKSPKKIIVGVCAMQRKANSKPMRAIMAKIAEYYKDWLEVYVFPEDVILNQPIEHWPLCDCLISFHATDFPLSKAIEYERLRRPYVINDLHRQYDLLDRRKVFRTLARAGIEHPRHCVLVRDEVGKVVGGELHEFNDHIEVNGMVFNKPFVEKPISAEDHNVYIYFPSSVGGGSQRLFRKVNDRSSWYSPMSTVRREGSYIYEEFIQADGTDVKVYAVGPYYAHAEARKAPGLDGKVERDQDGKEVRYPVILTAKEKMIARRVVIAFGQTVCGFDLLRANGKSYVCDVNGFSFVKTSTKYYEDTARILGNTILRRLASSLSIPWHIPFQADDPPLVSTPSGRIMELRCVVAVIRHGDRTPKQKMKVVVNDDRFFRLFKKHGGDKKMEIKMKKPAQLMEMLELIRDMLHEQQELRRDCLSRMADLSEARPEFQALEQTLEKAEDNVKTWEQMRTVLEMYGHFSGINRKIQMKYLNPKDARTNSSESDDSRPPDLMLIVKWGGELTTAGVLQAEALGKLFRTLYPGIRRTDGRDGPEDTQGLGFLRLHSTYRHDLKIYASDEGRVQMTAAAFAKGLLALEGELTPILMQMVKSANTDGLLNDDCNARQFQNDLKAYLHSILQADRDFTADDYRSLNPSCLRSIQNAMEFIRNPRKMCQEIAGYVQKMCDIIRWHKNNRPERTLYLSETWELAERRWSKELREFRKNNRNGDADYDISKIPDIYDNIKYDLEHNPDLCINNESEFERFYLCVKNMADIVVPQEYGLSEENKICIAQRVCTPLLAKIKNDLHRCVQNPEDGAESLTRLDPRASEGIATPMRHVRTRLYFTSESHIHTLMNLIRYGGLCPPDDKKWQRAMNFLSGVTEFNYMTQVVLMVYEDSRAETDKDSKDRFHVEILFSPGLYPCFLTEKERIYETRFNSNKKVSQFNSKNQKFGNKSNSEASDREAESDSKESAAASNGSQKDPFNHRSASMEISRSNSLKTQRPSAQQRRTSPLAALKSPAHSDSGMDLESTADSAPPKEDGHESDEELTDNAVNLVVLGEVAGKEYDEMGRDLSKPISRKRQPNATDVLTKSEDLTEEATPENYMSLIYNNAKELEEAEVATSVANAEGEAAKLVRFARLPKNQSVPNQIVKSMSDVACNRRHVLMNEESLDEQRLQELAESGEDLGLTLDANQATVGSGRGTWAKEILGQQSPNAAEPKPHKPHSPNPSNSNNNNNNSNNAPPQHQISLDTQPACSTSPSAHESCRPPLCEVFSRRDIIVMKRSESKEPLALLGGSQLSLERSIKEQTPQGAAPADESDAKRQSSRRSRFPYRFKHHTVNLLTGGSSVDNRLISTDVLMGKFAESSRKRQLNNPAVLSTAVIARSSSAPRLQTYTDGDEIAVAEIRRFWPPLRSLETMHDNIQFKQFDQFLEKMLLNCTPLSSPPKTPVFREDLPQAQATADMRLRERIRQLSLSQTKSVDIPNA